MNEHITAEFDTNTDIDTQLDTDTDTSDDTNTDTNTTTFPLTRNFIHCDSTGRELAHVSVTATITLTRVNGVTLPVSEIERRFRRNFYLSFKGGKASVSGEVSTATTRRTLSPEHKQKLQEARQRRSNGDRTDDKNETHPDIVKLSTTLLSAISDTEWSGKSAILAACQIAAIEPQSWTLAIRYLLDTNQIEARGEKRGREYRRVRSSK